MPSCLNVRPVFHECAEKRSETQFISARGNACMETTLIVYLGSNVQLAETRAFLPQWKTWYITWYFPL